MIVAIYSLWSDWIFSDLISLFCNLYTMYKKLMVYYYVSHLILEIRNVELLRHFYREIDRNSHIVSRKASWVKAKNLLLSRSKKRRERERERDAGFQYANRWPTFAVVRDDNDDLRSDRCLTVWSPIVRIINCRNTWKESDLEKKVSLEKKRWRDKYRWY